MLVLKFTNAEYDRDAVRRLNDEAAGLNVVMLDGYMDRAELTGLLRTADCYLSPHRAEGFGLTLLEAMSLGKPVVATNYSGNVDFMTSDNSYPVDYRLVALTRNSSPFGCPTASNRRPYTSQPPPSWLRLIHVTTNPPSADAATLG